MKINPAFTFRMNANQASPAPALAKNHMKSIFKYLAAAIIISKSSIAQTYTKIYYEERSLDTPIARYLVSGGTCGDEFIKSKLKVTNNSGKTIVIKPEECTYTRRSGGEISSKDRWMVIAPGQEEIKTIDVKGNGLKSEKTTLKLNGIYICNNSTAIAGKDIPLPPEKEFYIGNFQLELEGWDRNGKEMTVKYKVTYTGDKIGQLAVNRVVLRSPDGGVYKNEKGGDKVYAFKKKDDVLCEFVFTSNSKQDNTIIWQDAFSESVPEKTDNVSIDLTMDVAKTKEKNPYR
jgi:hypothetical protein